MEREPFERIEPKTKTYTVVQEFELEDFIRSVNFHIDNGYICIGGVSSTPNYRYIQAMILPKLNLK